MSRKSRLGRPLLIAGVALAVMGIGAGTTVAGNDSNTDAEATASTARCDGKTFSPVKQGNRIVSKAKLECTGDVGKMKLRSCLEQQVNGRFKTVECDRNFRNKPATMWTKVSHVCSPTIERSFRTKSYLFLRDVSGETASSTGVSNTRVYPQRC